MVPLYASIILQRCDKFLAPRHCMYAPLINIIIFPLGHICVTWVGFCSVYYQKLDQHLNLNDIPTFASRMVYEPFALRFHVRFNLIRHSSPPKKLVSSIYLHDINRFQIIYVTMTDMFFEAKHWFKSRSPACRKFSIKHISRNA